MEVNFSDSLNLEFSLADSNTINSEYTTSDLIEELSSTPDIGASTSSSSLTIEFSGGEPSGGGIDVVKVNGVALPIVNKTVDIPVPTKTSQLINDSIIVPTKTSQLINDSHFISDPYYVHTDNNFTNYLKLKLENVGEQQIYMGSEEPLNPAILVWIDTEGEPVVRNAMLTADDKYFITSDDRDFVPKDEESGYSSFVTSDNNYFYTSDNQAFMVSDNLIPLYTSDNKQFIDADEKQFITKGA